MKVYIFKTNIRSAKTAGIILNLLPYYHKISGIRFDMKKGNGVLTVTARELLPDQIQSTLKGLGYRCRLIQ